MKKTSPAQLRAQQKYRDSGKIEKSEAIRVHLTPAELKAIDEDIGQSGHKSRNAYCREKIIPKGDW